MIRREEVWVARPKLIEGSIDNAVARLSLWCRRATKGLARVSCSSEFGRREIIEQLERSLNQGEIPFYEIDLPRWEHPSVVLNFLLDRLESIEYGVVSVHGWATAIAKEIPLSEGLRVINFNRERLVRPALRQIWWMPRSFAIEASRAMPDLSSWFTLRLSIDIDFVKTSSASLDLGGSGVKAGEIPHSSIFHLKSTPPQNLPRSDAIFVGREQDIKQLHAQLQQANGLDSVAITGMGGVGKSSLALQYALRHKESYSGGICWLHAHDRDLGIQIISYCRTQLGLSSPENLTLLERVRYCWSHWPLEGDVLIAFDDVSNYSAIRAYLPPDHSRFKVLLTTRLYRLEDAIGYFPIDVLDESAALRLLESSIGSSRIEAEIPEAKNLCEWVEYLPLGLELVGHYLSQKPDLSLSDFQQELEAQKLAQQDLRLRAPGMRAELDIGTVFELSWIELKTREQELLGLLGLFALTPIPWEIAANCLSDLNDLEELRDRLIAFSVLNAITADTFQLHPLIREFVKRKIATSDRIDALKQRYCQGMVKVAQQIPKMPTLKDIEQFSPTIPHLIEAATNLMAWVQDKDVIFPFMGLGRYYKGQGLYSQAEPWFEQCLSIVRDRLGKEHLDVATALNNLAGLYHSQGRYEEAESLYLQALALYRKHLGDKHPEVASSLNDLALLYESQGRYEKAEPLYLQALALSRKRLGEEHPDVASSLNNLAGLYESQGRYEEAETLYLQALALNKQLLGENHPDVASSLNNLALLYRSQGRYEEAEPLYLQALALSRKHLGEDHPDVATSLNNLALLYRSQGRYEESETLFSQALAFYKKLLGEDHPHVAASLNNLAGLYQSQGRYAEAEILFSQALALRKKLLGEDHPHVAASLNNLAGLYQSQGRYAEAELLYLDALEIALQKLGEHHPNTTTLIDNFVGFLHQVIQDRRESELSESILTKDFILATQKHQF
ncbi:MAG: FxSxx-COOH system tetratricopeptide repeat protein [Spirulina sp.]